MNWRGGVPVSRLDFFAGFDALWVIAEEPGSPGAWRKEDEKTVLDW